MPNSEMIVVTGHLGRDAENIQKDGKTVGLKFSLAVGHGYRDKNGEWIDSGTTWYDVVAFGDAAAALRNADLTRGQAVRVQSRELQAGAWIDKEGNPRPRLTLKVWEGDVAIVLYTAKQQRTHESAAASPTGVPF